MRLKQEAAAFGITWFIRTVHATLRARHARAENLTGQKQYLLAFWHEHLLLMPHAKWRRPLTVLISRSKDGQIGVGVFRRYRVEHAAGSSSKGGGAALRELIRAAREGRNIVFTPDGPTGPPRVAKQGLIFAAQATGLPIVPVAVAFEKEKRLRSWDKMRIPIPFTRAVYLYGNAIVVPRDGDVEEWRIKVEQAMNELSERAIRDFQTLWQEGTR